MFPQEKVTLGYLPQIEDITQKLAEGSHIYKSPQGFPKISNVQMTSKQERQNPNRKFFGESYTLLKT